MANFGGPNVWVVTADERANHDNQFFTLKPVNGFITGEQSRGFLFKSGLPSNVLAQIWNLADRNKDGRMDKKEFSIAMHLIQKKLQGFSLPPTLPESMKADPLPSLGTFGPGGGGTMGGPALAGTMPSSGLPIAGPMVPMQPGAPMGTWPRVGVGGVPSMSAPLPPAGYGAPMAPMPISSGTTPVGSPRRGSDAMEWSMPQSTKLKYSQMFNNLDKGRVGRITGVHARNILCQAGLPNPILAQIWNLSDIDKDGQLTVDEFCLAMHFVEMVRAGATLPSTVPHVLLSFGPVMGVGRERTMSGASAGSGGVGGMEEAEEEGKAAVFRNFEDRRKHNFDKGQAELERRRALLQEEERKEREERERKDRDERERRERERMEVERRRQLDYEKQMARQNQLEQQRQEEQRKMMEQREAARREMDRQRTLELQRQRIQDLTAQRQREQEAVCHAKQKQKNLTFQLQALGEKSTEMNHTITEMRDKIVTITGQIEVMKNDRDNKMGNIERLNQEINDTRFKMQRIGQEKYELQSQKKIQPGQGSESDIGESLLQVEHSMAVKKVNMEKMKADLEEIEKEMRQKRTVTEERKTYLAHLQSTLATLKKDNRQLFDKLTAKQREAKSGLEEYRKLNNFETPPGVLENDKAFPPPSDNWFGSGADIGGGDWPGDSGTESWPPSGNDAAWGADTSSSATGASGQPSTAKYRALFEFVSRSEDELSFQPGDIILVFRDHGSMEPGWLAGQIKDKVGWFPEAFAECVEGSVGPGSGVAAGPAPQIPEAAHTPQKLPSIDEKEEDPRLKLAHSVVSATPSQAAQEHTTSHPNAPTSGEGEGVQGLIAQALYPWKAKKETHLTFQKGDQINILQQQEMWWLGDLNGVQGWFPKSYVRLIDGPRRPQSGSRSQTPGSEIGDKPATPPEGDSPLTLPSKPGAVESAEDGVWVVSLYPFAGPESGDLNFEAGERIWVTKKEEDWWTGSIGDRHGIFPSSYVQSEEAVPAPLPEAQPAPAAAPAPPTPEVGKVIAPFKGTAANQLTLQPGDMIQIRTKSPTGWWEGEVQRKGQEKKSGWFPGNYVKILGGAGKGRGSVSGSEAGSDGAEWIEVLFDYAPQQEDELELRKGERVAVVEKVDADWWRGRRSDGKEGLFPANYVKGPTGVSTWQQDEQYPDQGDRGSSISEQGTNARTSTGTQEGKKLRFQIQEFIETERNYIDDLRMVHSVFRAPLLQESVITTDEADIMFGNWEQLIEVAKRFHGELKKRPTEMGSVILDELNSFKAFVSFCQGQQNALDLIESKEKTSPDFRAVYSQCCQHPAARGMPLNYFLLLPLTRVTKYPLMVEKLARYSAPHSSHTLHKALEGMKQVCGEVNRVVTEVENLQMLYWSQGHVRANPATVAYSPPKAFRFHGRPGPGLLDYSFKLNRNSDLVLILYKQPILLGSASLSASPRPATPSETEEPSLIHLSTAGQTISFKALNTNAKKMWTNQLEKAINCSKNSSRELAGVNVPGRGVGRLLIELVCVRQLAIPPEFGGQGAAILCKLSLGEQRQSRVLDLNKKESLCTTQFLMETQEGLFMLGLYVERAYAPDLCVGTVGLEVKDLVQSSGSHRGPILRQIPLQSSQLNLAAGEQSQVILKFVVQLFG